MHAFHATVMCVLLFISVPYVIGGNLNSKMRRNPSKGAECGVSTGAHNVARIAGGVEARPHSWPWHAFILCIGKHNGTIRRIFGGGSIISDKWVITAAHVLNKAIFTIRRDCRVYFGKHNTQSVESTQVGSNIAKYVFHPNYKYDTWSIDYDLALIKLDTTLSFTDAIQKICLPIGLQELPLNKTCYVTGWGSTVPVLGPTDKPKYSDVLKQLPMTVQKESDCYTATYKESGRKICTGWRNSNEDVCIGDSGGPLACQEPDKKWYLRGVISHGTRSCRGLLSSTKVAVFSHWINHVIDLSALID